VENLDLTQLCHALALYPDRWVMATFSSLF
jgi:hypothetical protein